MWIVPPPHRNKMRSEKNKQKNIRKRLPHHFEQCLQYVYDSLLLQSLMVGALFHIHIRGKMNQREIQFIDFNKTALVLRQWPLF